MGHWEHGRSGKPLRARPAAGFHYRDSFMSTTEERALLDAIAGIAFTDFEMRGLVARWRVAFFGHSYDRAPAGPIPPFLLRLGDALAAWCQRAPRSAQAA